MSEANPRTPARRGRNDATQSTMDVEGSGRLHKRKRVGLSDRDSVARAQTDGEGDDDDDNEEEGEEEEERPSQMRSSRSSRDDGTRYYDPDQSMAERRDIRKNIRDLQKDLTGKLGCASETLRILYMLIF